MRARQLRDGFAGTARGKKRPAVQGAPMSRVRPAGIKKVRPADPLRAHHHTINKGREISMSKFATARLGALALAAALSGCATIVGHPMQEIPVASTPSEATITIVDEADAEVFKDTTPTTITLAKSTNHY